MTIDHVDDNIVEFSRDSGLHDLRGRRMHFPARDTPTNHARGLPGVVALQRLDPEERSPPSRVIPMGHRRWREAVARRHCFKAFLTGVFLLRLSSR